MLAMFAKPNATAFESFVGRSQTRCRGNRMAKFVKAHSDCCLNPGTNTVGEDKYNYGLLTIHCHHLSQSMLYSYGFKQAC
jgi:hypothetical protein